mmetsp:Transcript_13539/g.39215  ORF Transcript_13539/g.39215 Transcript_13539/m.39215 type:complete len:212 (-) Transcript_13539:270-905(-)
MVVQRGDGGRLHQAAGVVRLERLKRLRVDQLGRLVQRRGDGMATVLADLHVLDRVLVHLRLLKQLARLGVPLADPATVMRRHERAVEVAPKHARDAALGALNAEDGLGLLLLHVLLQLCQMDHRLRAHERIRRKRKHALADGQRDRTARLLLLELKELLARRQVPHAHRLVSRRREQARRVDVEVAAPHSAVVAFKCPYPHAVVRPPEAWL